MATDWIKKAGGQIEIPAYLIQQTTQAAINIAARNTPLTEDEVSSPSFAEKSGEPSSPEERLALAKKVFAEMSDQIGPLAELARGTRTVILTKDHQIGTCHSIILILRSCHTPHLSKIARQLEQLLPKIEP